MYKHNKSQMEIIGLVFIVLLISLVLLFAIQYTFKKPLQTTQTVKQKIIAENFITTMLKTTTRCQQRTIGELIQDCALTGSTDCGNGQNSCEYAQTTIKYLLDNTLKIWKKNYNFSIQGAQNTNIIQYTSKPTACTGEQESATHPWTITPGFDVTIKIDIC